MQRRQLKGGWLVIDTQTVLTELNLDDSEAEVITNLLSQAQDIIIHSVDSTQDPESYQDNLIFKRAVITLVTQLYYDRSLSNGMSIGLRMMINQLKGQVKVNGSTTA